MKNLLLGLALSALASVATAQNCSTLTITGTGAPGTTLTFTLTGTPTGSIGVLFIGDTLGNTTLTFGSLGSLELGLAQPFVPVPLLGRPGPGGPGGPGGPPAPNTLSIRIPQGLPAAGLHAQGTGASLDPTVPSVTFCTSNVESFSVGV